MIVLDSMGGNKTGAVSNIRQYLAAEWKAKMCTDENLEDVYEFSGKEMKTVRPIKPEQENFSDCGIYLLHYIEMMFKRFEILSCSTFKKVDLNFSVSQYYWPSSMQDLSEWFTLEEITKKREDIARLIRELSKKQNPNGEKKFPTNISFLPPYKLRKGFIEKFFLDWSFS